LIERSLERPWVDFKQELAFLDERSFLVDLPHQIAGHLSSDVGVRETVERADMFDIDLHILLLDRRDLDLRSTSRPGSRYVLRVYGSNDKANDEQTKGGSYPIFVF